MKQLNKLSCEPKIFTFKKHFDSRGFFFESFRESNFNIKFVQDNESHSKKGVIRGMHYQWDKPMGKLVRCSYGSINDFVIDIRDGSDKFGSFYKFNLSDKNGNYLWIPSGFAHGFEVISDYAIVSYKCTSYYNKAGESGINPFDNDLSIPWSFKKNATVSKKDLEHKSFKEYSSNPKFKI